MPDHDGEPRIVDLMEALEKSLAEAKADRQRVVQCVCGRLKQQGFICDFCYSTKPEPAKEATDD